MKQVVETMQYSLLIYKWGSQCEHFLCEVLKELGVAYIELKEEMKDYHADAEFSQKLIGLIHKERIHAVFSYDYFPLISMICQITEIPYISWIYDCPLYTLQSDTLRSPFNYIFCFDRKYAEHLGREGAVNCFHFPLAGVSNWLTRIEEEENVRPDLYKKFQCDISFVGNLYNEGKNRLKQAELSEYAAGYVEALTESQMLIYGYNFLKDTLPKQIAGEIVEKCRLTLGGNYRQDMISMAADAVGMEVSRKERERVLEMISDKYPLHLYTSSELPLGLRNANIKNMGYADYRREMPFIFHNSRINLNITSRTIETGIPQRVFDILSCGGFCLTNYQPEIAEFFEDGKELAIYTDMQDLPGKVDYYLNHEEKRMQIAMNGYKKICGNFELRDRVKRILDHVL